MASSNWVGEQSSKASTYKHEGKPQRTVRCPTVSRNERACTFPGRGGRGRKGARPRQPTSLSRLPSSPAWASPRPNPTGNQWQVSPEAPWVHPGSAPWSQNRAEKRENGYAGAKRRPPAPMRICWLAEKPASDHRGS